MRSNSFNADGRGNGPSSDYLKRIEQRLLELQIYDTATVTAEQTTRGTRLHAKVFPPPPKESTPQQAQLFAITSISNADYFVAVPITIGSSSGSIQITFGTAVNVAKHNRMRTSVLSELIDGVSISYSNYTSDNLRTASDGTNTEFQVAFPRYTTAATLSLSTSSPIDGGSAYSFLTSQCVVMCVPITSPIDSSTTWPMWQEAVPRVWARQYTQSGSV